MPALKAVLPWYVLGALCLVLIGVLNLLAVPAFPGHYFQPRILAITHLYVLGWATMLIAGASNQLAPVIAERPLFSDRLPVLSCLLLAAGLFLLIPSFWQFRPGGAAFTGALLILSALTIHAWNMFRTMRGRKAPDICAELFLSAHAWLLLTGLLGTVLVFNLRFGFLPDDHLHYLKIHAGIGMAGWFLQLITGIAGRLIPMFLLSRKEEKKYLHVAYYAINGGLVLFLVEGLALHSQKGWPLYLLAIAAGIIAFGRYVAICYRSALRKKQDAGMKTTFAALYLMPLAALLLLLTFVVPHPPLTLATAFGFSVLGGVITTIILGQTFKTLPFIVWMHRTRDNRQADFLPRDLYAERLVHVQTVGHLSGFLLFLGGILWRHPLPMYAGGALMLLAALLYAAHLFYILKQLKQP